MPKELPRNWLALRRDWSLLTVYQRFEAAVAAVLTVVIAAVILIALYRLIVSVIDILVLQTRNPLEYPVFQQVFGEILTLLIALEFNHTLQYVVTRERGIIQAKIVILIALLALVRKIIVIDLYTVTPGTLAALAGLVISLGTTY
ncbi:MAG TPA: phosphate-starvation-inducible PsiE family protein, partial [Gemmatimonadales bacterium]|nr:phosphate-starvation-inducible PsiE family protein [Gemmatimonadales bacterium]